MTLDLNPILKYFKNNKIHPWPFQEDVWKSYAEGYSGLINVPTGSGKTLAAFGGPICQLINNPQKGIQILYISPLRSITNDIEKAVLKIINDLDLSFRVEKRTGDTSQSTRNKQKKAPPEILLTTPESLALLLSDKQTKDHFINLKAVIVDEWHELMGNKRGVMLELLLAQLVHLHPSFQLWGMSATIGNLEQAAEVLGGTHHSLRLVTTKKIREVILETILPTHFEDLPWSGFFGLKMIPAVIQKIDLNCSTLLFTNTRAQAEKWYKGIIELKPEWKDFMAIHHSSIDRKERERVEEETKAGNIRLVICTSSLDLGIDFPMVERVFQVGSTKSVGRLIQRAGRSNHKPMQPCHLWMVPTHILELSEFLSLRKGLDHQMIEDRIPLKNCWDVLIQHLISTASSLGFKRESMLKEIKTTYAFSNITLEQLDWIINFLEKGGTSLTAYPEFHKLKKVDDTYLIEDKRIITLHRMNIGTIPSENMIQIKFLHGKRIGYIQENFINRLKIGESFMFGGKSYKLVLLNESAASVRLSKKPSQLITHWTGTRLPLAENLASLIRSSFENSNLFKSYPEYNYFSEALQIQSSISHVPKENELLIEYRQTREGHHLFYYPFESRAIHQTLNALVSTRMLRNTKNTFRLANNDYGCEILSHEPIQNFEQKLNDLFTGENLEKDLEEAINLSEMAKSTFRDIARIAGLVIQGYPSKRKLTRQIQMTTSLLYDVFSKYDPENLLLKQSQEEVRLKEIDLDRLKHVLKRLRNSKPLIVQLNRFSPFSLPLYIESESSHVSTESLEEIMEKVKLSWTKPA